jgi:hypothetical protein
MKEWGINTPIGEMLVDIKFFNKIKVKETRKTGDILFIHLTDNQSFSILEKDWIEISQLVRNNKIESILNK